MHDRPQVFKKQVDKLQTDHQGTFVLKDNDFRWTSRYAEGERERVRRLFRFADNLVRVDGPIANPSPNAVPTTNANPSANPDTNSNPNADANRNANFNPNANANGYDDGHVKNIIEEGAVPAKRLLYIAIHQGRSVTAKKDVKLVSLEGNYLLAYLRRKIL